MTLSTLEQHHRQHETACQANNEHCGSHQWRVECNSTCGHSAGALVAAVFAVCRVFRAHAAVVIAVDVQHQRLAQLLPVLASLVLCRTPSILSIPLQQPAGPRNAAYRVVRQTRGPRSALPALVQVYLHKPFYHIGHSVGVSGSK